MRLMGRDVCSAMVSGGRRRRNPAEGGFAFRRYCRTIMCRHFWPVSARSKRTSMIEKSSSSCGEPRRWRTCARSSSMTLSSPGRSRRDTDAGGQIPDELFVAADFEDAIAEDQQAGAGRDAHGSRWEFAPRRMPITGPWRGKSGSDRAERRRGAQDVPAAGPGQHALAAR